MGRRTGSPLARNKGRQFFYLFNDLSAHNVRTSVYHQRSYGTCTSSRICSPYATDTGSQGELDLCRYLHTGIGPAIVHRCPQLFASLENFNHRTVKNLPTEHIMKCIHYNGVLSCNTNLNSNTYPDSTLA